LLGFDLTATYAVASDILTYQTGTEDLRTALDLANNKVQQKSTKKGEKSPVGSVST